MIAKNRILIVDDDPGIRDLYRGILSPTQREEMLSIIESTAQDNYDLGNDALIECFIFVDPPLYS